MSWVDLAIVLVVAAAGLRGFFAGALRQIGGFGGLVLGLLLGLQIAPWLATRITQSNWRPALAFGLVLACALVVSSVGTMAGGAAASALRAVKLGLPDRVAGVLVGALGALAACWLLAGLLAATSFASLAPGIQNSAILRGLDAVLPPVPAVEARAQAILRGADFPNPFATLIAPNPSAGAPSHLGPLQSDLSSPRAVVKIIATGCASGREGTGFYVRAHDVVTNAHVVAGARRVTVGGLAAQVVLFDPLQDVAVLHTDSVQGTLSLARAAPAPGTAARVVGFPLNGTRTAAPAQVRGEVSGLSRDIYNRQVFTRTLEVLSADVQPGNSGSPVLVHGDVVGVVVSKSLSEALTAYAIPLSVLRADLAQVGTGAVSTQSCVS